MTSLPACRSLRARARAPAETRRDAVDATALGPRATRASATADAMFLVHRVLHPATAAHSACWARVASDHDELVLTVGRELHVYAIVNGSLALRRVWRFEASVETCAVAKRPSLKRDALVVAFAPARLAIIDDHEGEPPNVGALRPRNMPGSPRK